MISITKNKFSISKKYKIILWRSNKKNKFLIDEIKSKSKGIFTERKDEEIQEIFNNKNFENNILNKENLKPKTIEIITIKDPKTGIEKLINKNTGNEIQNLERKYDLNKRKSILINKETGNEINNIINRIDPETGEEIIIGNILPNQIKMSSNKEIISFNILNNEDDLLNEIENIQWNKEINNDKKTKKIYCYEDYEYEIKDNK